MMRDTSRSSYRDLVEEGKLGSMQLAALRLLREHGPGTSAEVECAARNSGQWVPGIWKRFSELKVTHFIEEIEKRKCTVTGKLAWVLGARLGCTLKQGELFE